MRKALGAPMMVTNHLEEGDADPFDNPLEGKFLVAMPGMSDENFRGAVIFLCAHSARSAMGIVVNNRAENIDFQELLVQLSLPDPAPAPRPTAPIRVPIVNGGPVERSRGFVLHSSDFFVEESTLAIDGNVSLTATIDVLKALAVGEGPDSAILALGYAGWGPGQLDREIQSNGWLVCSANPRVIFDKPPTSLYNFLLNSVGVDPGALVPYSGNA